MERINYRRYYFLIVITIIAVTVISQIIIRLHLEKQTNDGNKISIAGYQTAVVNEIAKYALHLELDRNLEQSSKNSELELKKSLRKFTDRHKALKLGNEKYNLDGLNSETVTELLVEASKSAIEIQNNVDSLLTHEQESNGALVNEIVVLCNSYAQKLNEVVYEFKKENSQKIANLKTLELILSAFMIAVLLLEIFLVIRPALSRLKESNEELIKTNDKLIQLNKTKSEFLANMSHEIRTPLNGVIGMAHILNHSALTKDQKDSVQTIKTSALNLLDIINEILDFSKLESGKIEVEEVKFSISSIVDEVLEILSPTAHSKGLNLFSYIDPKIPDELESDPGKIRQILTNLVGNAIKFTDHGEVIVQVERNSTESGFSELLFSVKDTGIGIPKEKLDKVFESFTQADNSTTRKYGGTGLGLSICKDLTDLLNGRIWVESEVGKGSTFYFTAVVLHDGSYSEFQEKSAHLAGKKALLVDDNRTNLKILIKILSNWGIHATPVSSPDLVTSITDTLVNFDVCILDLQMPEIDGIELAKIIREKHSSAELPIVMLSSIPKEHLSNGNDTLFEHFLNKPIKQEKLLHALSQSLGTSKGKTADLIPTRESKDYKYNAGSLKVLVVEDNAINRAVAIKSLELLGLPATTAVDGQEALKLIKSELFDVVLMDIQMPNLDGFETTTQIRKILSQNDQPVIIAMTAASVDTDKEMYIKKGMDDFLPKPLDLDQLSEKLNDWFE